MIFGKAKHKLPKTREELEAAMKSGIAAVIQTGIIDVEDGDPLVVLIHESGFARIKFPSGRVMVAQCPDVETAIQMGFEGATMYAGLAIVDSGSCRSPRIRVHRRPASAKESDWMRSIGMLVRFKKPDGTWTE